MADHSRIGSFGDVASAATLSRATKDGRIRRLAAGLYSADLQSDPAELIARNRWAVVARFVPDAVIADRSAAEGGMPVAGVLTVVSNERTEDVNLPGLIVAPRHGAGRSATTETGPRDSISRQMPARSSRTSLSHGAEPDGQRERSRATNSRTGWCSQLSVGPNGGSRHCGPARSNCANSSAFPSVATQWQT